MTRGMSLAILVLAVLAVLAGLRFTQDDGGTDEGCGGVRRAYERAAFIEASNEVPTTKVYADAAVAVRRAAIGSPGAVADDLNRVADAYAVLGDLHEGFDPKVPSTYHVIEDNTMAIEVQEATLESTLPEVRAWLDNRC